MQISECHSSVYVWGSTANGALGCLGIPTKVQLVPKRLSSCCESLLQSNVRTIIAGKEVTTLVTDRLEAYSWGASSLKNCTIKAKKGNSCQCIGIQLEGVVHFAHGGSHNFAITKTNHVYGWGEISHCHRKDSTPLAVANRSAAVKRKITKPRKIKAFEEPKRAVGPAKKGGNANEIKQVACGESFTCILRNDGTLIALGQLGIGCNGTLNNIRFKEIACGQNHCAAISSHGGIYTWGWGKNGRLGHGDDSPRNEPTRVTYLLSMERFCAIACGYAHTLVASNEDGSVFGFGWNAHKQVTGNTENSLSDCLLPVTCLERKGVLSLSCGFGHSVAITSNGTLFAWGFNEDGQCGTGNELIVSWPTRIEFNESDGNNYVVDISCGHSHTVCILSNFTPLQWKDHKARLQRQPYAAAVIKRFWRCALFRMRLTSHINQKKAKLEIDPSIPAASTKAIEQQTIIDDSVSSRDSSMCSSLSSHNSWDNMNNLDGDDVQDKRNNNDLARRLIEMTRMGDEDQRSQAYNVHLRALQERAKQKKKMATEEKRVQAELKKMQREDMLSREARKQAKHKRRLKGTKSNTIKNARANEGIQKYADRLKAARERKELQSKAKVTLPSVTRKVQEKKTKRRPALHQVTSNSEPKYLLDENHQKRTKKLLTRREKRIQTQQRLEKEADLAQRLKMKQDKEREQLEAQIKQKQMLEEQKRLEEARIMRQMQRSAEMQRLETELRMKDSLLSLSSQNKENNMNESDPRFRSLSHWTKTLYGQK